MYNIEPYKPKIRITSNGKPQEIYEFEDYNAFLNWADYTFINSRICSSFKKVGWFIPGNIDGIVRWDKQFRTDYSYTLYIVRDEFSSVYSTNEIVNDWKELRQERIRKRSSWWRARFEPNYEYRKDPVPGTHHRSHGRWCRRVKTTQERRLNERDIEFVRGRRRPHMLPNSWDDLYIMNNRIKSWKRHRDHQYKEKN
jgi:hypothetical protein